MSPYDPERTVVSFDEDDVPDNLASVGPDDVISIIITKPNAGGSFLIPARFSEVGSCCGDWAIIQIEGVKFKYE